MPRIRFGAFVAQAVSYADVREDVLFAESLGLDNAWLLDHHALPSAPDLPLLEAWTTLAALAVETTSIRLGTLVTNVATRNPAMLAKEILTVDQISGGRVDVGVGAGFYEGEHAAIGVAFLDGKGRARRLAEAVAILDRGLRGEHVTLDGAHFTLEDAPMHPPPTQRPRPPLFVGAHLTTSLRAAVQHGDAVVSFGAAGADVDQTLTTFRERMARTDELCDAAGRDPATLRRCYFVGFANEPLFGSTDAAADFIARFVDAGATDFSLYLFNAGQPAFASLVAQHRMADRDMFARVATEVLPQFA